MDGINTYSCQCVSSWKGENCTIEQDPCLLFSPCANAARCKRDPIEGIRDNTIQNHSLMKLI